MPSISTYHTFQDIRLLLDQHSSANVCLIEDAILTSNESFNFVRLMGSVSLLVETPKVGEGNGSTVQI